MSCRWSSLSLWNTSSEETVNDIWLTEWKRKSLRFAIFLVRFLIHIPLFFPSEASNHLYSATGLLFPLRDHLRGNKVALVKRSLPITLLGLTHESKRWRDECWIFQRRRKTKWCTRVGGREGGISLCADLILSSVTPTLIQQQTWILER